VELAQDTTTAAAKSSSVSSTFSHQTESTHHNPLALSASEAYPLTMAKKTYTVEYLKGQGPDGELSACYMSKGPASKAAREHAVRYGEGSAVVVERKIG
jgi:hypothetical protein